MMRIITGSARGTKLVTPEGESTRPTAERTKQAVFNILQFELAGRRVLDLFAGSGQLGLEALSRGAAYAIFSDSAQDACRAIRTNIEKTHMEDRCRLLCGEYQFAIRTLRGSAPFDLIFLDPPYASGLLKRSLEQLMRAGLIAEGAYIVCESADKTPLLAEGLTVYRFGSYGKNVITILKKISDTEDAT